MSRKDPLMLATMIVTLFLFIGSLLTKGFTPTFFWNPRYFSFR